MFQITQNGSYTFLNILIRADKLIIKVLTRSFIMVNTMMEIESTNFTDISIFFLVAGYGIYFRFPPYEVSSYTSSS